MKTHLEGLDSRLLSSMSLFFWNLGFSSGPLATDLMRIDLANTSSISELILRRSSWWLKALELLCLELLNPM